MLTLSEKQRSSGTSSLQEWGPAADAGLAWMQSKRRLPGCDFTFSLLPGCDFTFSPIHPSSSLNCHPSCSPL